MKRLKFKQHINLIRYAVRRTIHRIDIIEPEVHAEKFVSRLKKTDWLQWARKKLNKGI